MTYGKMKWLETKGLERDKRNLEQDETTLQTEGVWKRNE